MTKKIKINNQELLVLLEFEDSVYGKIFLCIDEMDKNVFVTDNKIINDNNIINELNKKYGLELPDELKGIIF